jgi:hypothetical protein
MRSKFFSCFYFIVKDSVYKSSYYILKYPLKVSGHSILVVFLSRQFLPDSRYSQSVK